MKYRIKDKTERELINALFGITELNAESDSQGTSLCIQASFAGNNYGIWYFKTEPTQELAEGWHPYPETKPEKKGKYLIAIDNFNLHLVDVLDFVGESFVAWNSSIIAWKELPKIWKE